MAYIIDANNYLPDFLQESDLMLSIVDCLNVIISDKQEDFKKIHEAYFDMIYKTRDYNQLTYEVKIDIVKELGFSYLLDISTLSPEQLTQLLIFFDLIYILKGKKEGLRLFLNTLGIVYSYKSWDEMSPRGERFTASLSIIGNDYSRPEVFQKIKDFVRSYMLPYINITVELTIEGPTFYAYPSIGLLMRQKNTKIYDAIRDVVNIAIYDSGDGYDKGYYGAVINQGPDAYTPYKFSDVILNINATPSTAITVIDGEKTKTKEVEIGKPIKYSVFMNPVQTYDFAIEGSIITLKQESILYSAKGKDEKGNFLYEPITVLQDTSLNVNVQGTFIACYSLEDKNIWWWSMDRVFIQNSAPKVSQQINLWYKETTNEFYCTWDYGTTWRNLNDIVSIPFIKFEKADSLNVVQTYNLKYRPKEGYVTCNQNKTLEVNLTYDKPEFLN